MESEHTAANAGVIVGSVQARLGFARPSNVSMDTLRAGDVLRAATLPEDGHGVEELALELCRIHDRAAFEDKAPSLEDAGFDTIDLSGIDALQSLLEGVRRSRRLSAEDAASIRRLLRGRSFRLSNGKRLWFVFVADEGIILRKSGPNGLPVDPEETMTATSGHGPASGVHVDQDVRGTPVRQILRGAGPWLFRHDAPDGANARSPFFLLNVWIPLQQITRPLALMDRRSFDRRRHQARYALPTEAFLDRDESRRMNDIWSCLHDHRQRWYFTSEMDARRAYVFNTLDTPHGAFVAPGEAKAEILYRRLQEALDAIARHDTAALFELARPVDRPLPADTTAPLRRAIAAMEALLEQARIDPAGCCSTDSEAFRGRAAEAMARVVRQSVELRAVAILTPDPFGR